MSTLGQSVKLATGKIEAVVAGLILVAVTVLFAKYYDRGATAPARNAAKPAVTNTKPGL